MGTLLPCFWECKLMQPLWGTVCKFLKKLNIELSNDPEIPLMGIYQEKTIIQKDTCTPMFMKWSEVKVTQSCLTLCDPMDYTVHGILQAIILEWVAVPSPGHLPNPGIKPRSPTSQADSLPAEPQGKPCLWDEWLHKQWHQKLWALTNIGWKCA